LLELLGGRNHPETGSLLIHLGKLCSEMNDFPQAIRCYQEAKILIKDLTKHLIIQETLADMYFAIGEIDAALREQRYSYKLHSELCSAADERTVESKKKVAKYLRAVTERNVSNAKEKIAIKAQQDENEWLKPVEKEETVGRNRTGGNKKGGKNKK